MLTSLLLTVAIATSAPAVTEQAAKPARIVTETAPSCMTGPIRVRLRTQGGTVQIAANAIRVDGIDLPQDGEALAE